MKDTIPQQHWENSFSSDARARLEKAGWFRGRRVDITSVTDHLTKIGYEVFPNVAEFLAEFHGIKVMDEKFPSHYDLDLDILHPYDFQQPAFTEAELYFDMAKHKLQLFYEQQMGGPFCFIGRTEIYGPDFLTMDRDGRVYLTKSDDYFDLIGLNAVHALENLLGRQKPEKDVEYFYKRIAPYNEDRLYEILTSDPVIVSTGHHNSPSGIFKNGYSVDRFLRNVGYKVYTVNSSPEGIFDTNDAPIFRTMEEVPDTIDIVTYHGPSKSLAVIEDAIAVGARIIFPSHGFQSPQKQIRAEAAGLEFIEGIGILEAYQRLIRKEKDAP